MYVCTCVCIYVCMYVMLDLAVGRLIVRIASALMIEHWQCKRHHIDIDLMMKNLKQK